MAMSDSLRTFRTATWLGWQIEANWTSPLYFAIYSVITPIAATLTLVVMYIIILGDVREEPALFAHMYIGNAFFVYVGAVMRGLAQVIHNDRERYRTLGQVYMSPVNFYVYVLGRTAAKILIATTSVIVTLVFGALFLGVEMSLGSIEWVMLIPGLLLGLLTVAMMGVALGGVSFLTAHHRAGLNEGVSAILYLFCAVVYPLSVLPGWGRAIGMAIPITYWLELLRRSLVPHLDMASVSGLGEYSGPEILGLLALSTAGFLVLSMVIFHVADVLARRWGRLDMITSY
jgi:ABC-2 type transport system permease protein